MLHDLCIADLHLPDVILHVFLHLQLADDDPGHNRYNQTGSDINHGYLPAEQPPEHDQRNFVDHWGRDEKRERNSQRHAGLHKTDKERHCRAGTERGDDAQKGGQNVADIFTFVGENAFGLFRRK